MPKYDVHIYAVVRVKMEAIEADSTTQAVEKAREKFLNRVDYCQSVGEFADDFEGYLVDPYKEGGVEVDSENSVYIEDESHRENVQRHIAEDVPVA